MKGKKPTCMLLVIVLIFGMTLASARAQYPDPQLPKLFVDPSMYTATRLGETVAIDINISSVQDLSSFEFKLSYNTTLLDITYASSHLFYAPIGWWKTEEHEPEGYLLFAVNFTIAGEGNGTLARVTFNTTYAMSASCNLDLYDTKLFNSAGELITHNVEDGNYNFATLNITVATNKLTYMPGENVEVHGNLTLNGSPQQGLVALEVDTPTDDGIVLRTLQIGPAPPPGDITILDVFPSNMWGEPIEGNFARGALAYFAVIVRNNGTESKNVAMTYTAYDGDLVPLAKAPATISSIGPGNTTFATPIIIPEWAYIGAGTVYASVFTELPRVGGVPCCPEKSAIFQITGSGGGGAGAPGTQGSGNNSTSGNYSLTFKLAPNAKTGIYRLYANTLFQEESVTSNKVFGVNVIVVPDHYPTIQAAVDAATLTNNTVIVAPATYIEHVTINKSITLVGADPSQTIIDGNGTGTVVTVAANNVETSRFTIRNSGVSLPDSGIALNNSLGCTLSENILLSNNYGIYLNRSASTTLRNNKMTCNKHNFGVFGDSISDFTQDIDTSNMADEKPIYYWINKQNSEVPSNAGFVAIVNSQGIVVRNLDLTKEGQGVLLAFTTDSLIERVKTMNNEYGIYMVNSNRNTIVGSAVSNNTIGIYQSYCNENIICHNNFTNNINQTNLRQSSNTWDDGYGKGNYWSDYAGLDDGSNNRTAGDGVGDTLLPHQEVDWHPLMNPWILVHDIVLSNVTCVLPCSESQLYPGWMIDVTVTIKNKGDSSETFNITTYYDGNSMETKIVTEMFPQAETTINFTWDTEGVSPGNYTISAEASVVPGETETTDNKYIYGNVTLLVPTLHNLAVTTVTPVLPYETYHAYTGWLVNVTVTVNNEGHYRETFSIAANYSENLIETKTVTMYPVTNMTITFAWNTTDVPCSNYNISAYVNPVPNETETDDNTGVDGEVYVRLIGDVSGEGMVTGLDVLIATSIANFMQTVPPADPYADVSGEGMITGFDVLIITSIENFMKTCPP